MKVLLAFYNGLYDGNNLLIMPQFYETIYNGLLKRGNEVFLATHNLFGKDFPAIPEEQKNKINLFNPNVCFVFNNSYYNLEFLECPLVVFEWDSCLFYSNQESLKCNVNRYRFVVQATDSISRIKQRFGANEKSIVYIPPFTEIRADSSMNSRYNIAFIGRRFNTAPEMRHAQFAAILSEEEKVVYYSALQILESNPFVSKEELKKMYQTLME